MPRGEATHTQGPRRLNELSQHFGFVVEDLKSAVMRLVNLLRSEIVCSAF